MKQKAIGTAEYVAFVTEMKSRILAARVEEAIKARNADNCFVVAMIGRKPEDGASEIRGPARARTMEIGAAEPQQRPGRWHREKERNNGHGITRV